jgi:hypothetical protein
MTRGRDFGVATPPLRSPFLMRDQTLSAGIGIDTSNSLSLGRVEPQRGEGIFGENNARFGHFAPAAPSSQARLRPSPGRVKKLCRYQCPRERE